jgi:D-3-phosphoglycerate dehydrogenase
VTVLVTTPSFGQYSGQPWRVLADAGFETRRPGRPHPLSANELAEELGQSRALIAGLDEVSAEVIESSASLRVIAKHGVGVDNIDLDAARGRGVRVVNAPGTNTGAVADLTMGLLLAAMRGIVPAHQSVVDGQWDRFFGPELSGRTLGIIGFGKIGQAVARRASGFDMAVIAYDPYVPATVFAKRGVVAMRLNELIAASDVISLHMPGSGPPLLGRAELALTKPGACLVNTARGGLVDEEALAELLHDGHLHAAAIDVFGQEPPRESPLLSAPNVVLTPHMGAFSYQANAAMGLAVAHDVVRVLRGEEPMNVVV